MFRFIEDWLSKDDGSVSRLLAMRQSKEKKCECDHCRDLISRIHFDGALTKHAHCCEREGLGFWNHDLPQVYEPKFNIELEGSPYELGEISPKHKYQGSISEMEKSNSGERDACGVDGFWLNHYRRSMDLVRSWTSKESDIPVE